MTEALVISKLLGVLNLHSSYVSMFLCSVMHARTFCCITQIPSLTETSCPVQIKGSMKSAMLSSITALEEGLVFGHFFSFLFTMMASLFFLQLSRF